MKKQSILCALSLIALMLCNVAYGVSDGTVLKKSPDDAICQHADASNENAVIAYEYAVSFVSSEQMVTFIYVGSTEVENVFLQVIDLEPDRLYSLSDHGNSFSPSVALIPDRICSPHGSVTYLQNKKICYRSPAIDNRWIWQYSVQYNC